MGVSPQEHRDWIMQRIGRTEVQRLPLSAAQGLILAEDVSAVHSLPLWDNSAMDGYALRSADTYGASDAAPVSLQVLGEVAAGSDWDPPLAAGQAVRIMTGAPLPSDADTIVRVEHTSGESGPGQWAQHRVSLTAEVPAGQEVRAAGEDLLAGATVARAGDELSAVRRSALAAAGVHEVLVHRAPRVAVLVTGAELAAPGSTLRRGQIPESNSQLIAGLLAESGIAQVSVRHCPDELAQVQALLDELAQQHEIIITTGGVGPGTHDVMRAALIDEPEVRQLRVAMRPGQHQAAGRLSNGAFIFALSGNPVSAAASFELFVRPALRAIQGASQPLTPTLQATAALGWRSAPGRWQVLPVIFEPGPTLRCLPAVAATRISHSVGGFGAAQGYALVEPERAEVAVGDTVTVLRLCP